MTVFSNVSGLSPSGRVDSFTEARLRFFRYVIRMTVAIIETINSGIREENESDDEASACASISTVVWLQ